MNNIKIIFCLLVTSIAYNSLAMQENCVSNSLMLHIQNNKYGKFEDTEIGKAQEGICRAQTRYIAMRFDLQSLDDNYKKYQPLLTSQQQNDLSKTKKEVINNLIEARNANDNANAMVLKNITAAKPYLFVANNSLSKAQAGLVKYKDDINDCIQKCSNQNIIMRDDLQLLSALYQKYQHLFTEKEQNNLQKIKKETNKYLDDAQEAKNNANAIDSNNLIIKNSHLFYENNLLREAKILLEEYKNTITSRIQERTAKL